MKDAPYLLIGIDAEGESRVEGCPLFNAALALADSMTDQDNYMPGDEPWKSWAIWGNHPVTGEWMVLAVSDSPSKETSRPLVPA